MNGAAKRDKQCALQDSLSQKKVGRILLFLVILERMFATVFFLIQRSLGRITCVSIVLSMRKVEPLLHERCYV